MEVKDHDVICEVENGGPLSSNKSINIPDVSILLPSLTEKDREDLKFAVENDFDFIAASFVRKAADVEEIRACLKEYGGEHIQIIAKIENQEGVDNLEAIIAAADGIMVARGDLGVEIPAQEGACAPEAYDQGRSGQGQARGYRHPDAGLHDPQPPSHPGGGLRCGQRRL